MRDIRIYLFIITYSILFLFNNDVFSKTIFSEAKYAPKNADVYLYIDLKTANSFFKKNGIDIQDIIFLSQGDRDFSPEEMDFFKNIYNHTQEMLVIGQTEKLEKGSGVLVFLSISGPLEDIFRLLEKRRSESIAGIKIHEFDKRKNVYLTRVDNVLVMGFKPYLITYIKSRRSKNPSDIEGLKNVVANSKNKTIYLYIPISRHIKMQMEEAIKKGAKLGKGLSSNVFAKSLLNLYSCETACILGDRIKLFYKLKTTNRIDGERIVMVSHFMIVGTSLAISFADMLSRYSGKKGPSTTDEKMEKIQERFGRIRTKQTGKGVLLSFSLNREETQEMVIAIKKSIEMEKKRREKVRRERHTAALLSATRMGDIGTVKRMLGIIGDKNIRNIKGESLLFIASKFGNKDIVIFLIEKGADINGRSTMDRLSPLHIASINGRIGVVDILIKKGADINAKSKKGVTPLYNAADKGHLEIVKALIKAGADIKITDSYGNTPAKKAKMKGYLEISELLENSLRK